MKDNRYKSSYILFGSIVFYFCIFRFLMPVSFAENDDSVMMLLASGNYNGESSTHLVFINYFLAKLISILYRLNGSMFWYPTIFLAVISISFAILTAQMWGRRLEATAVEATLYIATVGLVVVCTIKMQFTTLSGIALSIGIWTTILGRGAVGITCGTSLVLFAFLLRFEAAALATLIIAPFLVLHFNRSAQDRLRHLVLFGALLLSLAAHLFGERVYRNDAPEYYKFNELRGEINDNPHAALEASELPSNISKNDLNLVLNFFADPTLIGVEQLSKIRAAVGKREANLGLEDFLYSFQSVLARDTIFLVSLLGILMSVAAPTRAVRMERLLSLAIMILAFTYVLTIATLKARVVQVGCIAFLASLFFRPDHRKGLILSGAMTATACYLALHWGYGAFRLHQDNLFQSLRFKEASKLVSAWDGDIIVFKNNLRPHYALLFTNDYGPLEGKVHFAGWMSGHPSNDGFSGYLRLLERNVALFVDERDASTAEQLLETAFLEHYGMVVEGSLLARTKGYLLFSFAEVESSQ